MSTLPGGQQVAALMASALATAAGGAMDAWVYLAHGHVFANAQTGNVVLMCIALSKGELVQFTSYIPSLAAFMFGVLLSRLSGEWLKRKGLNSRTIRLAAECVMLLALGFFADHLKDGIVTACVGFIAGVQITSLSHIGSWSFNTGMTTGNLRSAGNALGKALSGAAEEWVHAGVMFIICLAYFVGALLGALLTWRLSGATPFAVAALVAIAIIAGLRIADPIPDWNDLQQGSINRRECR